MRRFSLPAAVVALAVSVTAADAGGGLPALAGLDVGPYRATLHNDSPWLRRGANTLTIEIPALPSGEHVALWLRGPLGQLVNVPLQPVRVLGATGRTGAGAGDSGDSGHGESDHAGGEHSGAAGQGSGTPRRGGTGLVPVVAAAEHTAGHAAGAGEPEAHDAAHDESRGSAAHTALPAPGPATFLGRGVVRVPTTGVWNAVVRIGTGDEVPLEGEAAIQTVDGGPNPLYLGATGSLIGASLLYGAVERQRRGARDAGRIPTPKKAR